MSKNLCGALAGIFCCILLGWGAVGDEWVNTRGDESPGQRYALGAVTTSGRIIGMTWEGSLMYSDDGGSTWKFDRIEIDGNVPGGTFSALYQVPGGELIAVMRTLEESGVGYFKYSVRTYLLTSTDNGNTWTKQAFPWTYATLNYSSRRYYGVDIQGLHMGPGGQLLAYGTTSGTNAPGFSLWSIGGAIFRRTGNDWVQANFEYGPVGKLTNAGGRAVAVSHNAILDSADGAGWNGYEIGAANINLDGGGLMDTKTRYRLRLIDVEVLGGTYIAQGATFVPYGDSGFIDTTIFEKTFKMSSPSPFSGARNWNAYTEPYHGNFSKIGNNIVTSGAGGTYTTSGGGSGFSLANSEMNLKYKALAIAGGTTAYGMQSSEIVWKTTNSGGSWTKILDAVVGPDLQLLGGVDGILYARAGNSLWTSYDLGESWQQTATDFRGYGTILKGGDGRLYIPRGGDRILVSADRGNTWETLTIPSSSNVGVTTLLKSQTGRLIAPSVGKSIRNEGLFYVSDDNGATWSSKIAGLAWNESPTAIVQSATGRIIVAANSFSVFNPVLYISDDDGETWTANDRLQRLDGLDPISNAPDQRVIQIEKMRLSSTGRLVVLGDDEILTSDDNGESWTVRVNMDYPQIGPNLFWDIQDITQAGNRWIAVGNYRTPYPQSRYRNFLLISDDDGATWGQRPFNVTQTNTIITQAMTEPDSGRVILAGGNGSVFVSDPEILAPPSGSDGSSESLFVREGKTESVPVERPDVDGAIEAAYVLQQGTAVADTDFKASGGVLTWLADDLSNKAVSIETIDNSKIDTERRLSLQLVFTTSDGFLGTMEIPVSIKDNDQPGLAGLVFENTQGLYTSESGDSVVVEFALESKPTADVVITVSGQDASEGMLSATTFTFTPANWNQLQSLKVTGIDDNFPDGDSTYELAFSITTTDAQYSGLPATRIAITNRGDEAYVVDGERFDKLLEGVPIKSLMVDGKFAFSFKFPTSGYTFVFGSEISSDFINWGPGPVPIAGATENGLTTYTLVLPPSTNATFARITYDVVPQ